jgi:hypothetical protein
MQKQPNRFWIMVLALAWVFDFLFWKHEPGIQFAMYVVLTLGAGYFLLLSEGIRPAKWTLALFGLVLFFAATTFTRAEPMTVFLAHVLTLFFMAGVVVSYRGGRWYLYSVADYISKAFQLMGSAITLPAIFAGETRQTQTEETSGGLRRQIIPILRGLLIALPVIVVFAALLSSADLIFAKRLNDLVELFRLENLPEYIFRGIYIIVLAYILAGVYLHAIRKSDDEKLLGLENPLVKPFFGFTEAAIVLGSVVILFASFVMIQFQYFFGGQANITLEGYTYAEYARRGFGELVTVAFFALLLFLGLSAIVKRESAKQHNVFAGLGIALVVLIAVMLLSAYQRLVLYEQAYGFTRLRTYTHVFLLWLGALLAVVVILDLLKRQRAFAFVALLASIGFAATLSLMNVDAFIVRNNIARTEKGFSLDVGYLASLSPDAVPALTNLYQSQALDQSTRDEVGAALACIQADKNSSTDPDWRAFNLAQWRADQALQGIEAQLNKYAVDKSNWPTRVTYQKKEYECWSYVGD